MPYHNHEPKVKDLTDDELRALLDLRGGCQCMHPPYSPPCSACFDPISWEECEDLGIDPLRDEPKPAVDYMKATRDLCR